MHVRPLNRNNHLAEYRPEWRLIEWSKSKDESIKYMDEIARRVPRPLPSTASWRSGRTRYVMA
jgi:hypothetical protein